MLSRGGKGVGPLVLSTVDERADDHTANGGVSQTVTVVTGCL